MINITDDVRQILRDGLEQYCDDGEIHFRLIEPTGEKISLMLDIQRDGDITIDDGDTVLLLIDGDVDASVDGDLCIEETEAGPRLAMVSRCAVVS